MRHFLDRLFSGSEEHLTDDRLAGLFCGELSLWQRLTARQHLANCWQCRLRKESLEGRRADDVIRKFESIQRVQPSSAARSELARKLHAVRQDPQSAPIHVRRMPRVSFLDLVPMNPVLLASMICAFTAVLLFATWWQRRIPNISTNALLIRAEHWDTSNLGLRETVVYQSVRITVTQDAKKDTVSRSLYRDTQGKRRPKEVKLNATEAQFQQKLGGAGLDWNEPLSATDYQEWHDHQHVREDRLVRTGSHLLRLTTTTPNGPIAEQSLTVRDSDFHPIQRTVALRDSGMIEIAEVDYKLLPWNMVDDSVFEPLQQMRSDEIVRTPAPIVPFPRMAEPLSEAQQDEAELAARLVLNQLHGDTGEQLDIQRVASGVVVVGVVSSEERKRELRTKLQLIPHVDSAIQTDAEANTSPSSGDTIHSVSVESMPDQPSLLRTLLLARGQSLPEINALAQNLYSSALTISRESKDIVDLQTRFGNGGHGDLVSAATLSELIYSHHDRLKVALKRERALLASVRGDSQGSAPAHADGGDLLAAANCNQQLVAELTQTNRPAIRSGEQILAEMSSTIDDLVVAVNVTYGHNQNANAAKRNQ